MKATFMTETEIGSFMASVVNTRFNAFLSRLAEKEGIPFEWLVLDAREILRGAEIEQEG